VDLFNHHPLREEMFGFRGEKAASAKPFLARWIMKIKSLHLVMENQMGGPPENLGTCNLWLFLLVFSSALESN
jgi:hypothetical protein